jgi:3-deoxy-D-manno-octulosonate 8-phosphate phosphatase (KDO 8-P phosphatase)
MNILSSFKSIHTFVFDMDGVLTDGNLYINQDEWIRRMNIRDGYALQLAVKSGYKVVVISGSESLPVRNRLQKLGVADVFMKINNKEKCLRDYMEKNNCKPNDLLCMGDDIPDYNFMQMAELICCPADAALEIKKISHYISPLNGGDGCVRDVIEKVMKLNNNWPLDTSIASI